MKFYWRIRSYLHNRKYDYFWGKIADTNTRKAIVTDNTIRLSQDWYQKQPLLLLISNDQCSCGYCGTVVYDCPEVRFHNFTGTADWCEWQSKIMGTVVHHCGADLSESIDTSQIVAL